MAKQADIDVEALDESTALVCCYGGMPDHARGMAEATFFRDAQGRDAFSFQVPLAALEQLVAAYVHRFGPLLCEVCKDYRHPGEPCAGQDEEEAEPLSPQQAQAALAAHHSQCAECLGRAPCEVATHYRSHLHA